MPEQGYGLSPGGIIHKTCLRCGATVDSVELHNTFHLQFDIMRELLDGSDDA